ncbi:MAG TPA: HAMP domain-containing sensor histidine kinase [Bacillota bacterium]|nr:HAMP domain-containing sensor histidine kinase [Bacillota bacterium]
MSKRRYGTLGQVFRLFTQVVKLLLRLLVLVIKLGRKIVARLLSELFKGVNKRLRVSITFKAATIYTFVFSQILLFLSILLMVSFGLFLYNQGKDSLEREVKVTLEMLKEKGSVPNDQLKRYAQIEGITIAFFDRQKRLTFSSGGSKKAYAQYELDNASRIYLSFDEFLNLKTLTGQKDSAYYIIVSKSLLAGKSSLFALFLAALVSFFVAIFLTVIIGSRTLKKMLKPIDDMIRTARSVSAQDLHTRVKVVASHDELKELAETFNEMLDRIQNSYELQNQFVSDASHELRTPISVIQGYANLLQRWGKEDKEVLDEALTAIKNESENMRDLVEKLLFLARADKDTQKLEKSAFSLSELVDEVIKETRLIDSEHSMTSDTCPGTETITLDADRALIKQALRIFIDNSLKHTQPGGEIKLNCYLKNNRVQVKVADNGSGIPKEDLPHIFNRFYKVDKSRTRGGGGTGLGLAIAKWIIEKHRGYIEVESVLAQGTTITITLPQR